MALGAGSPPPPAPPRHQSSGSWAVAQAIAMPMADMREVREQRAQGKGCVVSADQGPDVAGRAEVLGEMGACDVAQCALSVSVCMCGGASQDIALRGGRHSTAASARRMMLQAQQVSTRATLTSAMEALASASSAMPAFARS